MRSYGLDALVDAADYVVEDLIMVESMLNKVNMILLENILFSFFCTPNSPLFIPF